MVGLIKNNISYTGVNYTPNRTNISNLNFLAQNKQQEFANTSTDFQKFAASGINFLTCFGILAFIHKKRVTKSPTLALTLAAISGLFAAIHSSLYIKTPGSLLVNKIQKSDKSNN